MTSHHQTSGPCSRLLTQRTELFSAIFGSLAVGYRYQIFAYLWGGSSSVYFLWPPHGIYLRVAGRHGCRRLRADFLAWISGNLSRLLVSLTIITYAFYLSFWPLGYPIKSWFLPPAFCFSFSNDQFLFAVICRGRPDLFGLMRSAGVWSKYLVMEFRPVPNPRLSTWPISPSLSVPWAPRLAS